MRTICVTGVSRGIGLGFARLYLEAGNRVLGSVRDTESEGVKMLQQEHPHTFTPFIMDVSDRDSVAEGARQVRTSTNRIDLFINNAGTAPTPDEQNVYDIDEEAITRVFGVNVLGPLRCVQEFYPLIQKGDDPKIVMISSTAGSIAGQGGGRGVPYCVSKAALNMLTRLLYFHFKEDGIATVALHPGWVRTDMGGSGGALSVEQSVSSMMKVIERLDTDSPLFMDYDGEELPY